MAISKQDDEDSAAARERVPTPPWSAAAEVGVDHLGDARLDSRLHALVEQIGARMGASILCACQDRAATKAAYRFFANPRVDEA